MIPASYLYKNAFTQAWGDPRSMKAEPMPTDEQRPPRGLRVGIVGLLSSVLPLDLDRRRRPVRLHA